jgi:hypothetical protein
MCIEEEPLFDTGERFDITKPDLLYKFWKKGAKEKDSHNYLMIGFDAKDDCITSVRHYEYMLAYCRHIYMKNKITPKMYFVSIFEPGASFYDECGTKIPHLGLNHIKIFFDNANVDNYLRLINNKINTHQKLHSLELHLLTRLPQLSKPFNTEILKNVVELFYYRDIVPMDLRLDIVENLIFINHNRLSYEEWQEFWNQKHMSALFDDAIKASEKKGIRNGKQEAVLIREIWESRYALDYLEAKLPRDTIKMALGVTEEWLKNLEIITG